MTQEGFKRKLTSIFSADAVGYSRLMAEDEAQTVKTIASYREIMASLVKQHRGRVVDSPGDNVLAEFLSVVDAVQCAVAVQNEFQNRNAELAENRKMKFRIGINLGDVIEEDGRIYGDGVNIAARLEALADPGGICVSKTAFDQIETKLPLGYEYLGEKPVKNIPKPVGAYRVLMQPRVTMAEKSESRKPDSLGRKAIIAGAIGIFVLLCGLGFWQFYKWHIPKVEPASVEKMAYPLPEKPSIAVLPFDNLSGDPSQDYISDGISENIISALSQVSEMLVIARNSNYAFKGISIKVQRIAEELGVNSVLEGSVQKSDNQIRVTAQLIDALSGYHLWSEKYDRKIQNFFQILDEITQKIVISLQSKL
ncbi:MAG: adenylate/guanylate cyclase domain-containing protein, partial [Desulfobacterales bacterium]